MWALRSAVERENTSTHEPMNSVFVSLTDGGMFDANHQSRSESPHACLAAVQTEWINPLYVDQVASAVQTDDIREFIDEGWIRSKAGQGHLTCPRSCSTRTKAQGAPPKTRNVRERPTLATLERIDGCAPFEANAEC